MPTRNEMRLTFYMPNEGEFVSDFVVRHHRRNPWKTQSVAALLFSSGANYVALCFPEKVALREPEDRIRVPVQGRLEGLRVDPVEGARLIMADKAQVWIKSEAIHYLGFGYTRSFRTQDVELPYNKCLHFVYCEMEAWQRLPSRTTYARRLEWYPLASLKAMAKASMDERKAWFFLEALKQVAAKHTQFAPKLRRAVG
ncbi:MAG: hypothetical protein AUK16_00565 [Parcubacteria group bacterium CG2_30_44_11]|nr:MAG: hypothetical protein AUK16_00565 [Parcubacteria group bacterium CG2_30_44_11]